MSMSLKVYFDLMSQPSRAVILFLKTSGITYTPCPVALRKGEHFGEAYGKVNPFRKVPVIDHNGFVLTESIAIFRYLCRVNPTIADKWYPKDSQKQAHVDEYLEWQHINTRLNCAMFFRSKFLEPVMTGKEPNKERVERFEKEMHRVLGEIESIWLKNGEKPFIAGENISIADLVACCELEQPAMAGYDVFAHYKVLGAWRDRVRELTNPHYEEVHAYVRNVAQRFGGDPSKAKL